MKRIGYLLLLLFTISTIAYGGTMAPQDDPSEIKAKEVIAKTQERQEGILRQQLNKPYPDSGLWHEENFAFGAYYFNERTGQAQDGLVRVRNIFMNTAPDDVFWEENAHWHVYLLARLYCMYSSKSTTPRMSAGIESYLADIMYAYLTNGKYVGMDMVDYNYIWTYKGSENHHLQAYVSAWSAAHILKDLPEYQDMKIGDIGVADFARKFDSYFKLYFREKATKGLLTEIASPSYAKYSLNTIYNIYDFTDDAELKELADMFLNLYFADWAIEQFEGLRGGSKHRSYKGRESYGLTGSAGWFPFGLGLATKHPGFTCAATTTWRPDVLVAELALAQRERGTYEITSRRPGLRVEGSGNKREAAPEGGQLLRYTYHTPEFIVGMSMVPALEDDAWTAISSQNRCNLILFNGTPAKIYTQSPPRSATSSQTYNTEWGVQDKGVMILHHLPESEENTKGQLVFFSKNLNLVQKGGWVFTEHEDAYCAVKVVQGEATIRETTAADFRNGDSDSNSGNFLVPENYLSPIVFEVASKDSYSSFEAFQEEIQQNILTENGTAVTYQSTAYQNTLTLYTDYSQLPEINGTLVNLNPDFVYQSPFINGDFGKSKITISMGTKNLVLDFNMNPTEGEEHVKICPGEEYKGWTEAGSYQSSYISSSGNDSILTTHLTIASFKPTIVMNGNTLSSNEVYSAYQWYYAAGPISGATNPNYEIKWSGAYFLEATNEAGCTFRSDVDFYILTTLNNVEFEKFVYTVLPNPVNEFFNVRFDSNPPKRISLKLFNSLGQIIEQRDLKNPTINQIEYFNVSGLSRGIYYFVISDEKNESSQKIIKR